MTDEQIIKALSICAKLPCTCRGCPNRKIGVGCIIMLEKDALDLINRQKAEIEELKKENDVLKTNYESMCISLPNMAKAERKEAIKEFADKINELLARYSHLHNNAENARQDTIEAADGTDIEMQSVWDAFTLKNNEMAEYEEMNRLQKNIEVIAEERLLKEIEKDFRLLVREMTEAQE